MQEIEFLLYFLLGLQILEYGDIVLYLYEVVLECALDVEVFGDLCQGFGVFGNAEHYAWGFDVLDIDWEFLSSPFVGPEIEDFLWGACAFYGWGWLCEDCFA